VVGVLGIKEKIVEGVVEIGGEGEHERFGTERAVQGLEEAGVDVEDINDEDMLRAWVLKKYISNSSLSF
jgi:hypothetical protein